MVNSLSVFTVLIQRNSNLNETLSLSQPDGENSVDWGIPSLISITLRHLPHLYSLLQTKSTSSPIGYQWGQLKAPLGELRLKCVELFLVLFGSGYKEVSLSLSNLNVLDVILSLFFEFQWNNILHSLVENLVQIVLDGEGERVKENLLVEGKFVERLLDTFDSVENSQDPKAFRPGYMGHLIR